MRKMDCRQVWRSLQQRKPCFQCFGSQLCSSAIVGWWLNGKQSVVASFVILKSYIRQKLIFWLRIITSCYYVHMVRLSLWITRLHKSITRIQIAFSCIFIFKCSFLSRTFIRNDVQIVARTYPCYQKNTERYLYSCYAFMPKERRGCYLYQGGDCLTDYDRKFLEGIPEK